MVQTWIRHAQDSFTLVMGPFPLFIKRQQLDLVELVVLKVLHLPSS